MNRFQDINIIDIDQEHMLGRIHSFENSSALDGPGLRVVVFMQGCQFRCKYCHNRDSWDLHAGSLYSVAEVVEKVLPFRPFLNASNGGVTVSGGEAVLQAEFVTMLFKKLKKLGFHTCLDTNGYVSNHLYGEKLDELLKYTDLVLLDLKHIDRRKHEELVGVSNDKPRNFARYLSDIGHPAWIRHVLVPGYTDEEEDLRALAQFLAPMKNIQKVEILPYHRMGKDKWEEMGFEYPLGDLEPPPREQVSGIVEMFKQEYGLNVFAP
ncbi:pyruvate formate-lyase-activating protein [Teredinibacter franksiae]|jgi:pyruvate formate-lyase 1-activating enzyme|uniref:pyruvate formate-lyase-activating protein n=1 Tax=Teredinibacter franksiae TaxID=2761453 RepID=UPI001C89A2D9|nr:pyruvate formate-lyase-activating protein [Teredinibacter franksiae]